MSKVAQSAILLTCIWFESVSGLVLPWGSCLKSCKQIPRYYFEVDKSYSLHLASAVDSVIGGLPSKTGMDMQIFALCLKKARVYSVHFYM